MAITTLSSREFNQDTSRAKKASSKEPVFITDRAKWWICKWLILVTGVLPASLLLAQPDHWVASDPGFRVLNVSAAKQTLWVCGVHESIASSTDNGQHWTIRHQAPDGGLLLQVNFVDDHFGYSFGSGGVLLTTEDGGTTWLSSALGQETILQGSFSDSKHGLIRTASSLLFTTDGGQTLLPVSAGQNADAMKRFPYTFSLVTLDASHMAVLSKEGPYSEGGFLATSDAGKTWQFTDIPSTGTASLVTAEGKYWAIGHEVVGKDKPGGGYGVPMALTSSDGVNWTHSAHDISVCKMEGCGVCTTSGCLAANNTLALIFGEPVSYSTFPVSEALTPKWAATPSTICSAGRTLSCAQLTPSALPKDFPGPPPAALAPQPLGTASQSGPHCLSCPLDPVFLDPKVQGQFTLKLTLQIGKDGIVSKVSVEGAPTPAIDAAIQKRSQDWLFEPYRKDGQQVAVLLKTSARINVIRPR